MRRVVVTGLGALTPLGSDEDSIVAALQSGQSGIRFDQDFSDMGFQSKVSGQIPDLEDLLATLTKGEARFTGTGYTLKIGLLAMKRAVEDSGLTPEMISTPSTGLICGTGGPCTQSQVESTTQTEEHGPRKMGPFMVTPTMSSGLQALLCTQFGIKGINFSITSACATSAHSIGEAFEKIQLGKQTIMFAGGADDCHWTKAQGFEAMRKALAANWNDDPQSAARAFDANRGGFVDAMGAGMIVLEEYEHAVARGAKIYAELRGYGANSDGADMVAPSGEGAVRCMEMALEGIEIPVDYVNPHGTATPVGDVKEAEAVAQVMAARQETLPLMSSTKSMSGHMLGGAGVAEAIYTLLMMKHGFVAPSINIDDLDSEVAALGWTDFIPREARQHRIRCALSNSFGFGSTNASLVFLAV